VEGFLWCPHCGKPHALATATCPATGKVLANGTSFQQEPKRDQRRTPIPKPSIQPSGRRQAPMVQSGAIIDGRYKVGALLGRGGFGTVYEAENLRFGGRVALKILDRSDHGTVRRFNQEARIAGTILHPNVCRVFDVGWLNERPFIVMELLSGETLAARLQRKGQIKIADAIDMTFQVLAGLGAAHELGIVHRDVKPQNVFLVRRHACSPMVKLLDFGLAKALNKEPRPTTTMPGKLVGTIAYMSPEQLLGDKVDARTDLFSSAVLLFEAITGVLPWSGKNPADIGAAILRDQPRAVTAHQPNSPRELEPILACGFMKDRNRRFHSAVEFMRALGALQRVRPSIVPLPVGTDEDSSLHSIKQPPRLGGVNRSATSSETEDTHPMPLPRLYTVPPNSTRSGAGRRRPGSSSS
jgi:eukaryotic-like serine/threonine-protein kinase